MDSPRDLPKCFFERAGASDRARRLLLISYHFPPGQAAGAMRWQKLARHAAERGWGLDVVTLDPRSVESPDPGRLGDLPEGVRVFGVLDTPVAIQRVERRLLQLYRWLRRASRGSTGGMADTDGGAHHRTSVRREELAASPTSLRQALRAFSPRSWLRAYEAWAEYARSRAWACRAARLGEQLFDPAVHHLIVSCGPPHMVHEGARQLARTTGLPFVIDLRDPWSLAERVAADAASPLWYRLASTVESRVVAEASLIVMNTEPAEAAMRRSHPAHSDRIITVMNGYDEGELPRAERSCRFLAAYAGAIYVDRNPKLLFRAARRLASELELEPGDFGIELMGHVQSIEGRSVEAIAAEEGVEGFVKLHPPGTARQATEFLARAQLLVNLPQDSHLAIPSKVFEYMRHDAWLLALSEPDSSTELLLRNTAADVVAPDDVNAMAAVLRRRYRDHQAGRRPEPITTDPRFSRRAQADRLFGRIEEIVGKPTRSSEPH